MGVITPNMKVAEIIEADYHLLGVLSRLGVQGSFGEKTLSELCAAAGLKTGTVIMLFGAYYYPGFKPTVENLRNGDTDEVLRYLHSSHEYYLHSALGEMSDSIEKLIAPCQKRQQQVIWNFFQEYQSELKGHFEFEEGRVIPYVQDLVLGKHHPGFSIEDSEDNHSSIDEKLSDLRRIVLKSLPHECDDAMRIKFLMFLTDLHDDLQHHTYIEDNILAPMVRLLENPGKYISRKEIQVEEEDTGGELSEREKEILVSVASGMINKEIADRHNISINTVITHRKNITRKIGIKTVAGLTVYAILNNLIDINSIE